MQNHNRKKRFLFNTVIFLIIIVVFANIYKFCGFPSEIKIIKDKDHIIDFKIPLTKPLCKNKKDLAINRISKSINDKTNSKKPVVLRSSKLGTYDLELKLLGLIPVKKMKVHVLPELRVVPGGHSLGVKIRSDGVIVVGLASIVDKNGRRYMPAKDIGIEVGDVICKIDGKKVYTAENMSKIINNNKKTVFTLTIKRDGKIIKKNIKAYKNNNGVYQLGLWVRDIAAGVGTLTFYDPKSGFYGALGHLISDADTGRKIEVGKGEIIRSKVISVSPGKKNRPGEKKGVFIEEESAIGNILSNTDFGIFGKTYCDIKNPHYSTLPVAPSTQAHEGKAKILTVINEEKIEEFSIEIQKIIRQSNPNAKGMVVKITDPRLITKTGGIVQGMSGSPIVQDGYIIGAVTHVFVNDPTKGYGVFLEWMLEEISNVAEQKNN